MTLDSQPETRNQSRMVDSPILYVTVTLLLCGLIFAIHYLEDQTQSEITILESRIAESTKVVDAYTASARKLSTIQLAREQLEEDLSSKLSLLDDKGLIDRVDDVLSSVESEHVFVMEQYVYRNSGYRFWIRVPQDDQRMVLDISRGQFALPIPLGRPMTSKNMKALEHLEFQLAPNVMHTLEWAVVDESGGPPSSATGDWTIIVRVDGQVVFQNECYENSQRAGVGRRGFGSSPLLVAPNLLRESGISESDLSHGVWKWLVDATIELNDSTLSERIDTRLVARLASDSAIYISEDTLLADDLPPNRRWDPDRGAYQVIREGSDQSTMSP